MSDVPDLMEALRLSLFPNVQEGDSCPLPLIKLGKHSRLHIIARRINAGMHPLGHAKLANTGETCKTCVHAYSHTMANTYWKCAKVKPTGGPATDIRLKWPACTLWECGR